jgi:hypothetical protein
LLPLLKSEAFDAYVFEEESAGARIGGIVTDVRIFENDGATAAMIDFNSVTELLNDKRL